MQSASERIFLDAMMMQEPAWPIVRRIQSRFRDSIAFYIGPGVWEELSHPRAPRFIRERAEPFAMPDISLARPAVEAIAAELTQVLRGESHRSFRHGQDALNLAQAAVLGATRFLTEDRHLGRHAIVIGQVAGLEVIDAETFLKRLDGLSSQESSM